MCPLVCQLTTVSISLILPLGLGIENSYFNIFLDRNHWCALWGANFYCIYITTFAFKLGIEVIYLAMILDTNRWCALWCALWFDNLGLGIEVRYLAMILDKNGVSFGVLIVSLPIIFPLPYF